MVLVSSTKPTKGEKTMETQEEKGRQNKKKQETTLLGKIEKQDSKLKEHDHLRTKTEAIKSSQNDLG
jgi:hypothetical protein